MNNTPRAVLRQQISHFIETRLVRDRSIRITSRTPLVSSGLIDSFDLVELLSEVERVSGKKLPVGRIGPQDLESIERILDLVERF